MFDSTGKNSFVAFPQIDHHHHQALVDANRFGKVSVAEVIAFAVETLRLVGAFPSEHWKSTYLHSVKPSS